MLCLERCDSVNLGLENSDKDHLHDLKYIKRYDNKRSICMHTKITVNIQVVAKKNSSSKMVYLVYDGYKSGVSGLWK